MVKCFVAAAVPTVALLAILTGCAAGPGSTVSPSPTSAEPAAVRFQGDGQQQVKMKASQGARSVDVDVTCSGGGLLTVSANSDAQRIGSCDGQKRWTLPAPTQGPARLSVFVPNGVHVSGSAQLSTASVTADVGLADLCSAASEALQAAKGGDHSNLLVAVDTLRVAKVTADQHAAADALAGRLLSDPTSAKNGPGERLGQQCINNDSPIILNGVNGG